jgi:hypothetical protein
MAKIKRRGDSGSPCRKPLPCGIEFRGVPLSRTLEVEEVSRAEIQFRHCIGNPLRSIREMR